MMASKSEIRPRVDERLRRELADRVLGRRELGQEEELEKRGRFGDVEVTELAESRRGRASSAQPLRSKTHVGGHCASPRYRSTQLTRESASPAAAQGVARLCSRGWRLGAHGLGLLDARTTPVE